LAIDTYYGSRAEIADAYVLLRINPTGRLSPGHLTRSTEF